MNRCSIEGLYGKGVKVHLEPFQVPDFRSLVRTTDSMKEMSETDVSEKAPSVWAVMPPRFLPRQGRKILFTMMESAKVPKTFAEKCNNADEVWLPSKFNMDMFKEANVDAELYHMPLGVDNSLFKPLELTQDQKSKFNIKTKSFVFMSLFGWSLRKGCDVLLRSYLEAFSADDDVTLLIVSRKDGTSSQEKNKEIRDEIQSYIKRWCPDKEHPHIIHIGEAIEEQFLPILYNMSDCFVLPSRGEGFCLPIAEAGACEIPVISTNFGGHLDFLNQDNAYLVDIEGCDMSNQQIKSLSSYYEDVPFPVLGDKSVAQIKEYMHFVLENYSKAKEKSKLLKDNIVDNFSWDQLVDKIYKRIKENQQ